ncbi:MAG: dUTP diphosphatase [Deltaproteobacteria bacterium]|nr:dUTP diphosphatase [Deltaproteobacteria bacterium]
MNSILEIKRLRSDATPPGRSHAGDAGLDLFSVTDCRLSSREPVRVSTGIAMAVPQGFVGLICDRSSMGAKGIRTLGGVVDAGYRGEVQVILVNLRDEPFEIRKGDKIAQMLVLPVNLCAVEEVSELDVTSRAASGFGSTGR